MRKEGYYSTGQFAKLAQVTVRTIRFYDKKNILKPSLVTETGARFYTDEDLVKLQQILLFKYLGFSLEEISSIMVSDVDLSHLMNTLKLQKRLVLDRMEQMQLVEAAISQMIGKLEQTSEVSANDWSDMLDLIHLTNMEQSLKSQYVNSGNIEARIRLHRDYSINKQGWFPWIFEQILRMLGREKKKRGLELGCGNGALWLENKDQIPENFRLTLSDISEGMIREVSRSLGREDKRFSYAMVDCNQIRYKDASFDFVVANHVLFYADDIPSVIKEIYRILKPGGYFFASAYGPGHMKEITDLVQEFDPRIVLSAEKLYERFGPENGKEMLKDAFGNGEFLVYEDAICLDEAEPIVEYILSCHGNQNQYLLDRYREFKTFVEKKVKRGFSITKDAGLLIGKKEEKEI